jgi:DhnA family fructose-bisphosphate aldolase class Ia
LLLSITKNCCVTPGRYADGIAAHEARQLHQHAEAILHAVGQRRVVRRAREHDLVNLAVEDRDVLGALAALFHISVGRDAEGVDAAFAAVRERADERHRHRHRQIVRASVVAPVDRADHVLHSVVERVVLQVAGRRRVEFHAARRGPASRRCGRCCWRARCAGRASRAARC